MSKTWFSYVVLAVGLMMLLASDKQVTADDNEVTKTVEVIINKDGDEAEQVKLLVNGKEYNFSMPEIAEGEDQTITTSDGNKIIVKSISGNKMIWIDGKEMNLPSFGKHRVAADGLSAVISRSHQMRVSNEIVIRASGLSEDVQEAVVEAVKGVLTSYDVQKNVSFDSGKMALHFISEDGSTVQSGDMGEFTIDIKTDDNSENENVMIIHKELKVIKEETDQ